MIDVDNIVKEQADNMANVTEQQKKDFSEMATTFGNFLNCIWKQQERAENGTNRKIS